MGTGIRSGWEGKNEAKGKLRTDVVQVAGFVVDRQVVGGLRIRWWALGRKMWMVFLGRVFISPLPMVTVFFIDVLGC